MHGSTANVHDMELMEGEESKDFQGQTGLAFSGLQFRQRRGVDMRRYRVALIWSVDFLVSEI